MIAKTYLGRAYAVGLGLLLIAPMALLIDLPLALWARHQAYPKMLVKAANLSEFFAHGFGVCVVAAIVALLDDKNWRRGLTVLSVSLSAGLVADLLKLLIYRVRPHNFDFAGGIMMTFQDWLPIVTRSVDHLSSSFPSSHAATAAGLTFVLLRLYPKAYPVFVALMILSCAQRVFCSAHFFSDVLFGAGIGWCFGCFIMSAVVPKSWWSNTSPSWSAH
ncbi:MAG: phosphatase PAP2 family protein [Thermogutta sp.]